MNNIENQEQTRIRTTKSKRALRMNRRSVWIFGTIAAILLIAIVSSSIFAFSYDKVFPNVYADKTSLSGMTRDQVVSLLEKRSASRFKNAQFEIKIKDDGNRTVTAKEVEVALDAKGAADMAMSRGRKGSGWSRFWSVISSLFVRREVPLNVALNKEAVNAVCTELGASNIDPVDASYEINDDQLLIKPEKDGFTLDEKELFTQICDKFKSGNYDPLSVSRKVEKAKQINIDEIYKAVHTETKDAKIEIVNGEHKILPQVVGVDFDLEEARKLLEENPGEEIKIPLILTQPKVKTEMLESTLFKDTLSTVTTHFSPKKVERTSNVRLAASLINGTVLNPGEEFSYNKTVGPRTKQRGFLAAKIFASGEIVDGLGGGICQVSSTLYMAIMRADMKTSNRRNHSFYVDYAPKGQDATVVYGSIDFKFVNTSDYPIKILASSKKNYIKVTIMGTETQKKTVKFATKILSTTPFTERIVVDKTLAPGVRVITQKGQEGITMEVYRLVYDENGKLLRRDFENKTKYTPLIQIVNVGPGSASVQTGGTVTQPTKPVEPATTETPEKPVVPTVTETPETPAEAEAPNTQDNTSDEGSSDQTPDILPT